MIRETHKKSRITGQARPFRRLRAWVLGLCLAAGALLAGAVSAQQVFLRNLDGGPLHSTAQFSVEGHGYPGTWYVSGGSIDLDNITADYFFYFRGRNAYWPEYVVTNLVNPDPTDTITFYFPVYSNALSVVTTGIVSEATAYWSFYAPSALLTNSSAYATRYTHLHDGSGAGVSTYVNPLPTGTVTIVFSNVVGYTKPANASVALAGASPQEVTGVYTRQFGTLHILPRDGDGNALTNAAWTITEYPSDYAGALSGNGETNIASAPVGEYTVTFDSLAYYGSPTPNPITRTTTANTVTDFIATYSFTGQKLTVHVILAGETNSRWLVGAGFVERAPAGIVIPDDPESFVYARDTEVTLTAIPSNIVVDGVTYRSYLFEWTGRRWNGSTWINNELGSYTSPTRVNPITLKMDNDRIVTVLFSREKYPWDDAGDLDGDSLPDAWEVAWGLNPKDDATINGSFGNIDGDWIPSTATNPPTLVAVRDDSQSPDGDMAGGVYWVSYDGIAGAIPGYPLMRTRMLTPQTLGVGAKTGYAGGPSFHNLLECRGFDGFISTNGGRWTSATTFDVFWTPDDDPGTDPLVADTDDDTMTDGWEYYFWYWRSAEASARGLTASANLGWVTLKPAIANAGNWDTDGDGLTDSAEYLLGADPTHADTDGDSMDDWYEDRYELNLLDYSDALANTDADYMAVRRDLRVLEMTNGITNVVSGTLFADNVLFGPDGQFWVDVDGDNAFTLYTDTVLIGDSALSNGLPGTIISDVYYGMVSGLPRYLPGYPVWVDLDADGIYTTGMDLPLINPAIKNELVYMAPPPLFPDGSPGESSFSPVTAWFEGSLAAGYTLTNISVSITWTGPWMTERYNAYQEYLGGDYLGRVSWDAGGRVIAENDDFLFPNRTAFTQPANQDSDNDGIPDGWELYVGLNPNYAADADWNHDEPSPFSNLRNRDEWANLSHPLSRDLAWDTKIWPTDPGAIIAPAPNDPHPADTDWDGLDDGQERDNLTCPTLVDADRDGMPDGWERYAGIDARLNNSDADDDQDGLLNWQEYWTGTVPEWQYCDPGWYMYFLSRQMSWWDWGWDGGKTRVFLPPDFLTCPSFLYYNGIVTDLALLREEFPAAAALGMADYKTTYAGYNFPRPEEDAVVDPINPIDSDRDGMDDFWEVFHCLNPLVGFISKIDSGRPAQEIWMPLVGEVDANLGQAGYQVGLPGDPFVYPLDLIDYFRINVRSLEKRDPARFLAVRAIVGPHCFGCVNNDPDNDGLPNFQEYTYYRNAHLHTCPAPLWRTDPYAGGVYSFIRRNYRPELLKGWSSYGFGGISYSDTRGSVPFRWAAMTEGFDTDNDLIGDYQETTGYRTNGTVAASDPLDDQNPVRNRVLKLDGTNSWGRSYAWSHYGDFSKFTVEAWVLPARLASPNDQVAVEKSSGYTVDTPTGPKTVSLANFQLGIGADGVPYILFHGVSGYTTQRASASSLAGQLRPNEWMHLAGVFDGSKLTLYVNGNAAVTHHTTDIPARGIEGNYGIWHPNCNLSVGARELVCGWHFPVSAEKFFSGSIDEVRVWDRALPQSEIILRKDRELTPDEVGTVLAGNSPYTESVNKLFAYYTFNSLPDPAIDGIVPSEFPLAQRPPLSKNYSQIYNSKYLVIAADRVKRIPRLPPLDTRVIGSNAVATDASPDAYGISASNYLAITLPDDFRNPANPYNFTHSTYNIDMGRGLWMCGRAYGARPDVTWMQTLDPTDPDSTDADGDGLPDWWEILYGLDPYDATGVNGRWGDPDTDGLSNWAEYMAGTNPMNWDTDGDGLSDYDSRSTTDPYALTWGELYDDGDGMPDTWESEYGLDPKRDDSYLDNDNDGWSNYAEFIAGTDPSRSGSHPSPRVTGRIIYTGQKTGQYRVWGYQTNSMDGPEQASQIGLDNTVSEVIGYADGTRSYNGRLPYAPVRAGTAVRISAIMYWWDGQQITYSYATFTFTGPETFTYEGRGEGEGVAGRMDYNTGEFSLTWANDEVPYEGNEISVSYPYLDPENPMFGFSGFKEGPVYLAGILDVNGNNQWDEGEPFGVTHGQPYHLGVSDLRDLRIYLHENLPGYHRFKWSLPGSTNISDTNLLTHVIINHTSIAGSPNHFDLNIRAPRNFFHEWDCQRYGFYGMPAGSYRWWAGAQNGTFFINWSLPERAYAVAPRGATLYAARNQFEWTMGTNATMYHLQVARKESDGRLTMVEDRLYPAPGRDRDGICRDYPDAYASEWGNGTYFWRVAGWNPAGQGPWSGDDLGSVQTFEINLNSSYTRTISGKVYYYGKTTATRLVVEAFDNIGFSGMPEARVREAIPRTSDPNKIIPFTIKGLPEGAYYVRAYIDTAPFGGTPSGEWAAWKTQGFVQDNNNMYKPGQLALVNTMQLTGRKLVLRDHDLDNDMLPDAWEMEYFGSLNQTGDTDFDGDGETNYQEYQYSSGVLNPRLLDTDDDGLTDAFEVHYNGLVYGYQPRARGPVLNPTVWDSDGDGYSDGAELRRYNTDPLDRADFPYYRPPCYGPAASPADIDGDGRTDAVVYDPTAGDWHVYTMAGLVDQGQFGDASMTPLTGDFDGDGCSDLALYQAASGLWQVWTMSGDYYNLPFGLANMIPVPGDYDGDMFTELALYDRVTGAWHIYPYNNQQLLSVSHGGPTHIPVPGDYDGDGRTDLAVYDPASGVWSIRTWFGQNSNLQWGGPHEIPVPGDYDGDGRTDLAVFNANTGWWRVYPMNGQPAVEGQFGWYGVIPVPGDYNGDGRTDPAYYYPPTGAWSVLLNGREMSGEFGPAGATPVLGRR